MDKLKQRREDRKKKAEDDKNKQLEDSGAKSDAQFEMLMRLKKGSINLQVEPVK